MSTTADFTAHVLNQGNTREAAPATLVTPGATVVLHWSGPVGEHTLYSDRKPEGEPFSSPFAATDIQRDTVFTLKSIVDREIRYDTITVTVDKPTLPGLAGLAELAGGGRVVLTVTGTRNPAASVGGEMRVAGAVEGANLAFPAKATLGPVTVTGTVRGSDAALDVGDLRVDGTLTSKKSLAPRGRVSLFGEPSIHEGGSGWSEQMSTDGFVVGAPLPYSDNPLIACTVEGTNQPTIQVQGASGAALPVMENDQVTQTQGGPDPRYYVVPFGTG
ncbi:hypothetical protein [Amycolatopsis panacis]|uniref:Uncharacterized protein n=1 Tax=Amycolatopsis panacis TaxID=2340917 RepID=A0A419I255_9PSEU|nr:hypothetical protein [Amycolatopsis panacis]RJQ83875.1 hypothetical protein D5S19_18900 [Amycolatopsis panacis]